MMNTKTDRQLKLDIETELAWDPELNAAQVGVSVDDGAVTLLGAVDTYAQKCAAEVATKRIYGVKAIAQRLTVKLAPDHERTDEDLAAAAQNALRSNVTVPSSVTAHVERRVVTLQGDVRWNFEREAAENAVRCLTGVEVLRNEVAVTTTRPPVVEVKDQIRAALERQAAKDTSSIHIHTTGHTVTLTGHASSWQSMEDAAAAAWAAPGVTHVLDFVKLQISTS
ncbi:MAG: putative periplasmic phospholipid-binding protein [Labilithrix sp.]|nr:putative periplasmic phospholipid-binding protein [Labilithrix sp.]